MQLRMGNGELKINKKGFTLLEMVLAITIIGLIYGTISQMYVGITKSFFVNSESNEAVNIKSKILTTIKNDLEFDSIISDGSTLTIDSGAITYYVLDQDLKRDDGTNDVVVASNVDNFLFELKEVDKHKYLIVSGKILGRLNKANLEFSYPITIINSTINKWDYIYDPTA